jgi:hypothetical protein
MRRHHVLRLLTDGKAAFSWVQDEIRHFVAQIREFGNVVGCGSKVLDGSLRPLLIFGSLRFDLSLPLRSSLAARNTMTPTLMAMGKIQAKESIS